MSLRGIQSNNIPVRTLRGTTVPSAEPWIRNPAWPVLTPPSNGEQKVVGLYAVFPGDGVGNGGNFFAVNCAGAYTVNYGDGTSVNTATGVQTNYEYNFADVDLYKATVTFTDAGDLISRTAHGYNNGDVVQFYRIVTTTGLTQAQSYYVISATADTFQVSATVGGSAIALTTNGSAELLPYRIATVTITPQAGQNLTTVNLAVRNSTTGLQTYSAGWLDLAIAGSNITTLAISLNSTARTSILESVNIVNANSVTSFLNLFQGCASLRKVNISSGAALLSTRSMFNGCAQLEEVPLFNTASVTDMVAMFQNCASLRTVPLFNTASVTVMSSMFSGCTSLQTVPLFNTASVTIMGRTGINVEGMFLSCTSLQTVPLFNTASVTNMQNMFANCPSLQAVPLFNTASVTNMSGMFANCLSLQAVPLFNTSLVSDSSAVFSGCTSLTEVPLLNTASAINMARMFNGCTSLQAVPLFNTALVTDMNTMFSGCTSLTAVPALVTTAVSSAANCANIFLGCRSLARIQAEDFRFTFTVASCKLSAAALNEIYTNLPTVTGQTITVTDNYGTVSDNPAIATAKGWTVTG